MARPLKTAFITTSTWRNPFTPEILKQLEKEMNRIIKQNLRLERFELPREEALKLMEEKAEPYKVELIHPRPARRADATISFI